MSRRSVLRLLDANANRALEGMRVCEDIARFHLRVPRLVRRLRALRHAVAAAVRALRVAPAELAAARASRRDIGRRAPSTAVGSLERLLLINFQRTKESLRVLEEVARLLPRRGPARFQRLRFLVYEAERDTLLELAAVRHRGSRSTRRP